jgi:hypothetical protein
MLPLSKQRYRGQVSAITHLNLVHGNPYYELYASWGDTIGASDSSKVKNFLKRSTNKIPKWFASVAEMDDSRKFQGTDEATFHIEYQVPALREKYLKQKPKHIVLSLWKAKQIGFPTTKKVIFYIKIRKNLEHIKKQYVVI